MNLSTTKSETSTNCRCKVNYISKENIDFDGSTYGSYRKTIHQADTKAQTIIDYVNSLTNTEGNL